MDDNKVVKQIADWMVESGTENTTEGNWIFNVDKITEKFGVTRNWVTAYREEIVDALYEHEAVADVIYEWLTFGTVEYFDIDFYTGFCPNVDDEN